MFILDTDIVIWILRGEQKIISAIDNLIGKNKTGISTITVAELYKFAFPSEYSDNEDFINHQQIFPVTQSIAKDAGLYWNQFHKKLLNLSITDTIIAATAKSVTATLLTLNTRHFPMTDIKVASPLKNT